MPKRRKHRNKSGKYKQDLLLQYVPKPLSNLILSYAYQFCGKVKNQFFDIHQNNWIWGLSTSVTQVCMHHDDGKQVKSYNMLDDTYYDIECKENEIYLDRDAKLVGCYAVKGNPPFHWQCSKGMVQIIGGCIYFQTSESRSYVGTYDAVILLHSWLCLCLDKEYTYVYDLQNKKMLWTQDIVLVPADIIYIVQHGFIYETCNSFVMCIVDRVHFYCFCASTKLSVREIQSGLYASNGVFCACNFPDHYGGIIWCYLDVMSVSSERCYICYRNKQYYLSEKPSEAKIFIHNLMMLQDGLLFVSFERVEAEFNKKNCLLIDLEAMKIVPFPTFLNDGFGYIVTIQENTMLFQDGDKLFVLE